MQKIDHKIIVKSYEYFSKNAQLFIRPQSLKHDLKIDEKTLNKAIERLGKIGHLEFNNNASSGSPYQLSEKGITYAQQNTKSFFEKFCTNRIVKRIFGSISFIVVYFLGLYTDEIKSLINKLFEN
jgi:hypothetical protein